MDYIILNVTIFLILIYLIHKISVISDDVKEIKNAFQYENKLPESVIELLIENKRNDAVIKYSKSEGVSISRVNQVISSYENNGLGKS